MDSVWVVGVSILPVYDDSTKETKEDSFSPPLIRVGFDPTAVIEGVSECKYGHGTVITSVITRSSVM